MATRPGIDKEKDIARLQPPQSVEAEQDILGSILKEPEVISSVIEELPTNEHFYVPKHRLIYKAILNLFEKNEPCDITTVAEELTKMNQLDNIGGRLYLIELVDGIATTANAVSYAKIVLEKSVLRNLINTSSEIVKSCYNLEYEVTEILDRAEQNIFAISESRLRKGFVSMAELVPSTFEQIEHFQDTKGGLSGIETGFAQLDAMTGGLHDGEFVVIAGRPSMGKTAFALNVAEFMAVDKKVPVGIFSIEMSKEQLVLRLLCGRARISQHLLRTNRLRDADWQRLSIAADPLSEANIYIDDSAVLSPVEVRAKARRLKAQHNVGLIIVDYIQMMTSGVRAENRQQEMALISRSMKTLAKELNIPVIAVSQLSRMVEMRGGDKRPQLSDLRESGAIEQDADVVMFVYRPEFYMSHLDKDDLKRKEVEGRAELIVAKQRNGPTGVVNLAFVKDFIRFENLAAFEPAIPDTDADSPF
ncbi:MAG: replicative DNA helicase [candidate division Zixibacteria bacterium HGW-Zixibacteria-1]|nr:MAG: replicative DNA helicase [candidate division Zixibacteria bacterium HGW-Zixibacteria-1]